METDGNGLYYMRARYYNESVKRFINQDVLAGTVADSPSLAFSTIGHSLLGLVGFIVPGVGELADVVNAAWYFAEGDTLNGWLSLGSALPGIGSAAGQGIKLAFGNGSRAASMAKLVKDGSRLVGHAVTFGQTAYHGSGTAVEMYDKYYVQGLKPGADTVLEAGSLVLDVVTCVITGKSLVSDVQSAVQSVRVAGREMSGFFREKRIGKGGSGATEAQILRTGDEWYEYFNGRYGKGNVTWKPTSFDDILQNPERLYGSTQKEIADILGDGWTAGNYGVTGTGWKFTNGDGMVFYHSGGRHDGAYYGFSTGATGKVKIVGEGYVPLPGDKATVIYFNGGD